MDGLGTRIRTRVSTSRATDVGAQILRASLRFEQSLRREPIVLP
jgi:hypothetical protein